MNPEPQQTTKTSHRPRIVIIGAGSRGSAYARAVTSSTNAIVHAVADPVAFKRKELGRRYVWHDGTPQTGQAFDGWHSFLTYELSRRRRATSKEEKVEPGVDAAFICTLDEQHAEIIIGLAPLGLHILSEKPLATTLEDCLRIYSSLLPDGPGSTPQTIFGIGHVLRYSPHNTLLRQLLLEDRAVGDVVSIEHTEPVGWWHFSHSYVRGNWRREDTTAPSLLTKSCHDIDLLLWLLASPTDASSRQQPHLPTRISSSGHLNYFRHDRKPKAAGHATNCLSCPIEGSCMYSAKKIYLDRHLKQGRTDWPVKIVSPEIEDCYRTEGAEAAEKKLLDVLKEDYDGSFSQEEISSRPWFGRCVWESDNNVCDDQSVVMEWDDAPSARQSRHFAKSAIFHMIAHTQAQCERRGVVYGTEGEITYNSRTIEVYRFSDGESKTYHPKRMPGGHGGGDDGLVRQFVKAVKAVMNDELDVVRAQQVHLGCTFEDVLRSHAAVFAAEEARRGAKVVGWKEWWEKNVEHELQGWGKSQLDGARDFDREWEVVSSQ